MGTICCAHAWLSGFQPRILDLIKDPLPGGSTLVFSSFVFLEEAVQVKLYDFIKNGGTLVFFGDIQLKSAEFRPCNKLQELLELEIQIKGPSGTKAVRIFGQEAFIENQSVTSFPSLLESDEIIAESGAGPCGFIRKVGAGKICLLGFHFSDRFSYFPALFGQIMKKLGTKKVFEMENNNIIPLLRKSEEPDKSLNERDKSLNERGLPGSNTEPAFQDSGFLFLGNYHDDLMNSTVSLVFNGETITIPVQMKNRSGVIIPLFQAIAPGLTLCYSSCEVIRIRSQESEIGFDLATDSIGENFLVLSGREIAAAELDTGEPKLEASAGSRVPSVRISWQSSSPQNTLRVQLGKGARACCT